MARALTLCLLAAALAFAACGESGSPGVSFQLFGDAAELAVYRDLVREYERRSGQAVRMIEVPDRDAHLAKLSTSVGGDTSPDVFLINYRNFGSYAARGALDPVGPRLDRAAELPRSAFYREPLEAFTYRGTLQCLPQNVSSLVTYYNRDLFRAAGLDDPTPDWTYEQFREAAARLTKDANGDGTPERHGVGVDPGAVRAAAFVWAAGGELVDDADRPTRLLLDTPASKAGLEQLLELRRAGLSPTAAEAEARPLEERFLDGNLAMLLSSRREVPNFRTITSFDWDVAPFPRSHERATVLHSDGYCLARRGETDAAWRFVRFAGGPDGQRILARGGRTVPSLKAVAASDAFLDPRRAPRSSRVFIDAIAHMRRMPSSPEWAEVEKALDLALERAYYGELTLDDALERIDREASRILGRR